MSLQFFLQVVAVATVFGMVASLLIHFPIGEPSALQNQGFFAGLIAMINGAWVGAVAGCVPAAGGIAALAVLGRWGKARNGSAQRLTAGLGTAAGCLLLVLVARALLDPGVLAFNSLVLACALVLLGFATGWISFLSLLRSNAARS